LFNAATIIIIIIIIIIPLRVITDHHVLVQWDYSNSYYNEALDYLTELVDDGGIKHLGLTNFDTSHLKSITDSKIKIVSNQVRRSLCFNPFDPRRSSFDLFNSSNQHPCSLT